jgi:RNA polymerase sigma factor (sigma-70 family)
MRLEEDLFRREKGRIVAALTRLLGIANLELAEDVVQDALCRALEIWTFTGIPENPSAWLMTTARNRAIDVLRRERTARTFAPQLVAHIESDATLIPLVDDCFHPTTIRNDQLRMMFSCCDPRLSEEAQIALVLHILGGFSVGEIAHAFLATEAAIKKRILRAKKLLADSKRLFELEPTDVGQRLDAVHRALYLLFNEGFHGACDESAVQLDLCRDAMGLVGLLLEHPASATPSTRALLAIMCFHAARLPARVDASGQRRPLVEQHRELWDRELIADGVRLMNEATTGTVLSEYHVEATIASIHCSATGIEDTNWAAIVSLYDILLGLRPSPVVALQRAIAIAEHLGPERGIEALDAIEDQQRLVSYPFYSAARGEMELRRGRPNAARDCFRAALTLARNSTERDLLAHRVDECDRDREN